MFRVLAGVLVLQALLALEVDPYFSRRAAGLLDLPSRAPLYFFVGAQALCALTLCARRGRWSPLCAGAGLLVALTTLFVSCPFNAASAHAVQTGVVAVGLVTLLTALARGSRAGHVSRARKLGVAGLVTLLLLASLEGLFSCVPRSHAVGYTLAARLWFKRYWFQAANPWGYRDTEHVEDGRPKLFVLGDSFVSGVGIRDVRDRFSDLLREKLSNRWQVHNLGWNGADTRVELERLELYPFAPDALVLSYFVNDIQGAAEELAIRIPPFRPYAHVPPWATALIMRSYLLNFAYWQLPHDDLRSQGQFLAECFSRKKVVEVHEAQLERLLSWARERRVPVVAVLFPNLAAPEATGAWLDPARAVCARNGVPVVDVSTLVRGLEPEELVVNANDSHPNERVHALVAEALAPRIAELEATLPAR